jgi:cell division protein FtsB
MLEFYEKRKLKRLLYSKWMIGLLFIIILFLLNGVWNVYQKERSTNEKRDMVEKELAELVERERALQDEMNRLSTERGIEEEIREKYNVARVGEEIVVIVDAPSDETRAAAGERKSFWSVILDWF